MVWDLIIAIASLPNHRTMVGITPATQKTYPPQPEVEFGFPQTCYCGVRRKLATSRTVNDPGRRYYTQDEASQKEYDWVSNCVYANYKIPTKCIYGGAITVEADDRGRNYYVCKDFKNDGLHIRHDCLTALEEELDCLSSQYAEEVSLRRELQFELAQMREEIKELKQLIMVDR
ncbi:hypothetical protein Bca52824_076125 [Brassica carinata]|uniref:Uncharacterized protein n=1 Tax=Brassica carinata TaxID=52824 RepID=A0A8X7TX72_BRACI|nr:hypothetical protein Bca52824_076125 [Brassica carinata]